MSETGARVLIVDDEPAIRRFLRVSLSAHGYAVFEADGGQSALSAITAERPDLIILDLGLPDLDGLTVARRIREWASTPILVLSARGQERDKVAALDAGADDYVTKPFGVGEFMARMRVALRHAAGAGLGKEEALFEVGDLRIDLARRHVVLRGDEVHLTPIEYRLLATLVKYAGRVVTHRQLLREVWGPSFEAQTQYLRVHMQQLRKKLEDVPANPRYLRTEPGVGYRLVDE